MPVTQNRERLFKLYDIFPFEKHPLWRAILAGELSYAQVIEAEVQHCIRTKFGQTLRKNAVDMVRGVNARIFELLLETYLEECTSERGTSHLDLIRRLVTMGGYSEERIDQATPTPGNIAAIALYRDISARGAGCHMLGAGVVEFFYCQLSPRIFEAYVSRYGMSPEQAETYRIHGPMDKEHAERAFAILPEAIDLHGWDTIEMSVRDAFVATSLHYDGMLQAATGRLGYWDGRF